MTYQLDQTGDFGFQELHRFTDGITLPAFVKEAEMDSLGSVAALDKEAFADQYHLAFPLHTPSATYLSHVHFVQKEAELVQRWGRGFTEEVAARLKTAGTLHNILPDLESYCQQLTTKQAAAPEERTVYTANVAGADMELFPFKTAEDLIKQAADFASNLTNYPFEWRQPIAESFWKHASVLGVEELPDILCKYAGMFFPDPRTFSAELQRRQLKLAAQHRDSYIPVLEKAAQARDVADYLEVCRFAYETEKQAGAWDSKISRDLLGDIVDNTFTLTPEKIAQALDVVDMGGDTYRLGDLQKVSKAIYKEAFGCDFDPDDRGQLRDVLPTMPGSDVALFRELSGVRPL